uniref:ADF-H domain-containing protein n=1 Tax=Glossina palpalis gambiensis TaxID=67801 RepID=A0A1B0BP56_9MUSC
MLNWIQDISSIRQKMVYASTKAILKTEFVYQRPKNAYAAPASLTSREEELVELRKTGINNKINTESKHKILGGLASPLPPAAEKANEDLLNVTFGNRRNLPKQIPEEYARNHLYLFKHTYDGESFIFIYSMSGYTCSVRERIMYSSCKAPFLEKLQAFGVEIVKKVEIDSDSELTTDFRQNELQPKKILHRLAFAKPKGPPNRGAKRITQESS